MFFIIGESIQEFNNIQNNYNQKTKKKNNEKNMAEIRYSFVVEYFDQQGSLTRTYNLLYYVVNNTIEMYDLKTKRCFLKRCSYPSLSLSEIFVGATINVFSRTLKVVDYGDEFTRGRFMIGAGEFMLAITERGLPRCGDIISWITAKDLRIQKLRMVDMPSDISGRLQVGNRCILVVVQGSDALKKMHDLSAQFKGAMTVVGDPQDASVLENHLLSSKTTAVMKNCAVCVIKPHAITSGHHGPIIQRLLDEGFIISALGMFSLAVADAEDFLEVYNGVVPEYKKLVEELSSGPVIAMEIRSAHAVPALRAVCGPHDPEVCHVLFPDTLRSRYGLDRTRNAVHCTDLPEDGDFESEFFFTLLLSKEK